MARIVNNIIEIPAGVTCVVENENIVIKGVKGSNVLKLSSYVSVEGNQITVNCNEKALLKTRLTLIKNAIKGVVEGYETTVMLYGVGYKVVQIGKEMEFFLGFSHTIKILPPEGVIFELKSPTQFVLKSCSNALLGDFVAKVTKLRKQNPYKTKGVIKEGSFIRKKEGKK